MCNDACNDVPGHAVPGRDPCHVLVHLSVIDSPQMWVQVQVPSQSIDFELLTSKEHYANYKET